MGRPLLATMPRICGAAAAPGPVRASRPSARIDNCQTRISAPSVLVPEAAVGDRHQIGVAHLHAALQGEAGLRGDGDLAGAVDLSRFAYSRGTQRPRAGESEHPGPDRVPARI